MRITLRRSPGLVKSDLGSLVTTEQWIAFDTEGTGLDPWGTRGLDREHEPARPFAVSLCDPDGETGFERWRVDPHTRKVSAAPSKELTRILGDASLTKVLFNAPYDLRMLRLSGVTVRGPIIDVVLMVQVLDPDAFDKRLKPLAARICGVSNDDEKDLTESIKKIRQRVRSARLRVKTGSDNPEDKHLAKYAIHEPEVNEWEALKTKDDSSIMADCFLGDYDALEKYARIDALRTALLYENCKAALDKDAANGGKLWDIYHMEQKLQVVVTAMEDRGIRIDPVRNDDLVDYYLKLIGKHTKDIRKYGGVDFNPKSWKGKQKYFFKDRNFIPIRYSEKKNRANNRTVQYPQCQWCKGVGCKVCQNTGRSPKCDGEFLELIGVDKSGDEPKMKEPLAWHILHHSASSSMLGFCSAFKKFSTIENGVHILHPNYRQAGPVTGRFSAERPNLQNVADDDSGKKKVAIPYRARESFIPRDDHVLYLPDYSQIEIWILYLRSKDKELGKILLSGGDTHGKVAQTVVPGAFDLDQAVHDKNLDPTKLTPGRLSNLKAYVKTRKKAKNTQFCKVYGGGAGKIAQTAGCSLQEAEEFVERYESTFTGITEFMDYNVNFTRKNGYIQNAYGRTYPIDRDRAYVATNYDIQGSAADLIKRAMIAVYVDLCEDKYKDQMFLELTIHDELCLDVHMDIDCYETQMDVANKMQADYKLLGCPIPFPVGMKIATERWSESKEVKL